jgi:hypothetical protein
LAIEIRHTTLLPHNLQVILKKRSISLVVFNELPVVPAGSRIRNSLLTIEKAIAGLVLMSADLETAFRSVTINVVSIYPLFPYLITFSCNLQGSDFSSCFVLAASNTLKNRG